MGDSKAVNYMEEIRAALSQATVEGASLSSSAASAVAEVDTKVAAVTAAVASHVFTLDEDF